MNKIKLLLMLLLVSVFTAQAQVTPETLTVNDGTVTDYRIPVFSYYTGYGSYYSQVTSQFVIPDYDITDLVDQPINKLTFYLSQKATLSTGATYQVYLKIVDNESLTTIESVSDATVVYSGPLDATQDEMVIEFDRPYEYQGGHLLIGIGTTQMGSNRFYSYFYGVDKRNAARCSYTYLSSGSSYNYVVNFLPKTTFSYGEDSGYRTVSANVIPEEGGTVTGDGIYRQGRQCTLTAIPAEGYSFEKWTMVSGENEIDVTTNPSFNMYVTDDMTYNAYFTINTYNIEAYANPEEAGTVEGTGEYNYSETCTLTATVNPDSEYHFAYWTKNGIIESTDATYTFEVYDDAIYYANFAINEYEITATVNNEEAGYVTGTGTYAYGVECTLTAITNYGYEFVNWTLDGEEVSTETSISFEVQNNAEYVANFNTLLVESDELTINDGDYYLDYGYSPMYVYYFDAYTRSQYIILADELADMGPVGITSLTYYFDPSASTENNISYPWTTDVDVEVYLTETTNESFSGYFDKTSATVVYSGSVEYKANGEVTINFTTPYTYNGGNLVVGMDNLSKGTYNRVRFYGVNTGNYVYGHNYNYINSVTPSYGYEFSPKTTFTYNVVVPEESDVAMTPEEIDFGRRANGAWSENNYTYAVTVANTGKSATIIDIAVTNPYFEIDLGDVELPYTLKYNKSVSFSVAAAGSADGEVEASLVLTYNDGETVETTLSAIAYTPVEGDVWETAIVAEFNEDGTYDNQLSVEDLNANYIIPTMYENTVDAVYKVTFDQEVLLSAGTTGNNAQTYIYDENFNEVGGPSWYNTYNYNGPVYANNRGNRDNNNFINETFDGEELPEGWSVEQSGMNTWTVNTDNHYASCSHNINAGQTLQGLTWLVTPTIDISAETNVLLKFKYMNKQWDNDIDGMIVSYRNDNGEWHQLMATTEAHETWTDVEISLDSDDVVYGQEFQIGFAMNDNFGYGLAIDDVLLMGYRLPEYQIVNNYIPAGTYYVLVSSSDEDFQQVNMQIDDVMVPEMSYVTYPNESENVAIDAYLSYNLGWFTEEMQVLIGVTNPPTDVLLDWTAQLVPQIQFQNLEYNKKYYVQVNGRNVGGTTEGAITYFTTIQAPVENFLVDKTEVYYGTQDILTFTWDAADDALGYNLYYGYYNDYSYEWYGPLNDEVVTGTEFAMPVDDVLWYDNENPFMFAVKAVYKYGVSDYSDVQFVNVSGFGYINGYVYEQDGVTPIEGVTITMTGVDEFGVERSYEFTTDENGYYTYDTDTYGVYVGTYTVEATIDGYQSDSQDDVTVAYNTWAEAIFTLTESYTAPQNVVAVEDDETAVITWEYQGNRSLQSFNIYRTNAYNFGPYETGNTEIIAQGVTGLSYIDETWAELQQGEGSYKYGVSAVYEGNAAQPTQNRGNRELTTLLSESFDNSGLPAGWQVMGLGTTNWSVSSSSNAGGTANELRLNWNPQFTGVSRMVMPAVDLTGAENVVVSFKRSLNNYANGHYLGVATSSDGGTTWNIAWQQYFSASQSAAQMTVPINTSDVGNDNVLICIFFSGSSYNINYWYFDDILITAEIAISEPVQSVNESEIVWSEPLDINMEIENGVDITVTLNNGESPEGVQVVLTNNDSGEVIEVELDETGTYAWETFRKGDYNVSVTFNDDYSTVAEEEVSIWGETHLEYTLNYLVPMTTTAVAYPEDYGSAKVYNGGEAFDSYDYLYGDEGNVYAVPYSGKEFLFWMNSDTLVSTEANYYYTVTVPGDYVAYFRTAGNHYVVDNPQQYADNMSFIGIIQIEGETQNDFELEVGAFAGNECRGSGRLNYYEQVGGYLMFLTVYGEEEGENIKFRLYSHATGEEYDLRCATSEAFAADAVFGSLTAPYVFNFVDTVVQNVVFAEGWNWMSTYIEQDENDGLAALEAGLGTNGVSIVSQSNGFVTYDEEYDEWSGNLTALNNEEMFKVNTSADVEFEMEGYQADVNDHVITLYNGWTYLGFISMEPMSIEEAFAGFTPTDGDMVKAQEGFATYDAEAEEWSGSLNTLNVGLGFMYKSNNEDDVTFTYPTLQRGETQENVVSEHWTANVHAYPNNMTVIAVVELNDEELAGGDYELAAFANGEVCGSVKLVNAGTNGRYYAFLTVAGNDAVELNFALYDALTGEEMFDGETRLSYSNDAMVGSTSEPFLVSFRGTTNIDELNSNIAMYPNPAEKGGYVRMIVTSETNYAQVEIVNSLGQVVSVQSTTQMPANIRVPEEAGVYTVKVITEGKNIKCQKLIVE